MDIMNETKIKWPIKSVLSDQIIGYDLSKFFILRVV